MAFKRMVLEMGTGTDLHGRDYTKAAVRAVKNTFQHASLTFNRSLGVDPNSMRVDVTVGVARPEEIDPEPIRAAFPYGTVSVRAVAGGLDIADEHGTDTTIMANVAIEVFLDLP